MAYRNKTPEPLVALAYANQESLPKSCHRRYLMIPSDNKFLGFGLDGRVSAIVVDIMPRNRDRFSVVIRQRRVAVSGDNPLNIDLMSASRWLPLVGTPFEGAACKEITCDNIRPLPPGKDFPVRARLRIMPDVEIFYAKRGVPMKGREPFPPSTYLAVVNRTLRHSRLAASLIVNG